MRHFPQLIFVLNLEQQVSMIVKVVFQYLRLMPPKLFPIFFGLLLFLPFLLEQSLGHFLLLPKNYHVLAHIMCRLPCVLPAGVALPFNSIHHLSIDFLLSDNVLHFIALTHIPNYYISHIPTLAYRSMLDDCFEIDLSIKKITDILFLSDSHLIILFVPHRYLLLQIEEDKQVNALHSGRLPGLAQDVRRMGDRSIVFVCGNELHIFDVFQERSLHIYSIPFSPVYSQQFHYDSYFIKGDHQFLFYKVSFLKGVPTTLYYQLHWLALTSNLQRVKRLKIEYPELRKFGYTCGEIFSYQLSGYQIEVSFVQSGISHRIQSIFNLFLISIKISPEQVELSFTHNDLQNELASYKVCKKKVEKWERKPINSQKHVVYNHSSLRSLVFKNCYNHRKQDPLVGIFRFRAKKEAKMLHLIENSYPHRVSNEFKQLIIQLLK